MSSIHRNPGLDALPTAAALGPGAGRGGGWVRRAAGVVRLWRRRVRGRRELASLDDRMLRDIGLSRFEVEAEGRKPFWRA